MTRVVKQKFFYIFIIIFIIVFIITNTIKSNNDKPIKQTYFYMGTIIEITIFGTHDTAHLDNISKIINDLDHTFSRNIEDSEISRINNLSENSELKISEDTYNVIESSIKYSQLSEGYFDITINPLVELWGIGTEEHGIPNQSSIDEVLPMINYQNIKLDPENRTVTLLNENTTIDLGAIAKGYVADVIVDYLNENNLKRALISLGGNVYAFGNSNDDTPWTIGIKHPDRSKSGAILSLKLENKSVVTSGIYERFFEEDGKIYHHILNPFTGFPVQNNILSLTIISDKSIDGDALSTSMFCLGKDEALRVVSSLENIEAIIITKDKKIYMTSGLENIYEPYDLDYEVFIFNQ